MKPMHLRCGAALALFALLARSAVAQEPVVTAGIERAKTALEQKDAEGATLELRGLEQALEALPSSTRRTTLRNQVLGLWKRADPRQAARSKALETTAKALVKAAKAYTAKRWHRTALELLELAARLAPQHAAAPRDEARLAAASTSSTPAQDLSSFFAKATQPYEYDGKWKLESDEIHSPAHVQPLPTLLRSAAPIELREYFVEVEARTDGEPGEFALCIGHRGAASFALLELFYLPRNEQNPLALSEQRFLLLEDGPERVLATAYPSLTPRERRGWVKLRVEVRGQRLRGIVAGCSAIEAEITSQPLTGHFGLFVASSSQWKGVTRFRNLRWGPLEAPAAKR